MRTSRVGLLSHLLCATLDPLGGQAVLDGVVMRCGNVYGLAVRRRDGTVLAQRLPWRSLLVSLQKVPFLRGFPILLEAVVNGTAALNRSAALTSGVTVGGFWGAAGAVLLALALALGLFMAAPHLLSLLMAWLGLSGDVDGFSFHLWDGFFKATIFVAYAVLISFIPEIRRLFACHGAEHKAIGALENQDRLFPLACMAESRFHPRCGTAFVLFVVISAVIMQSVLVPMFLHFWDPAQGLGRHGAALALKLALIIPISGFAYELITFAASLPPGPLATFLRTPGLALQRLTTREPSLPQMQVALVALAEALGHEESDRISTGHFIHLDEGETPPLLREDIPGDSPP